MTKEKKITIWIIVFAFVVFISYLVLKPSEIEQLYKDKANIVEEKLEQTSIRDEAQAKIDAFNEKLQVIDSRLFDAINGTTTTVSTGTGLEQASQPQVVVQ